METFHDKLAFVQKSVYYSLAVQKPQLKFKKTEDIVFDYEFCNHFKSLEHQISAALRASSENRENGPESSMTPEQLRLLQQYKDLIRDQDQELTVTREEASSLRHQNQMLESEIERLNTAMQQLKDQNSLLTAQNNIAANMSSLSMAYAEEGFSPHMFEDLKRQNEDLQNQVHGLEEELSRLRLEQPSSPFVCVPTPPDDSELRQLHADNLFLRGEVTRIQQIAQQNDTDMMMTLSQKDAVIESLQFKLQELEHQVRGILISPTRFSLLSLPADKQDTPCHNSTE